MHGQLQLVIAGRQPERIDDEVQLDLTVWRALDVIEIGEVLGAATLLAAGVKNGDIHGETETIERAVELEAIGRRLDVDVEGILAGEDRVGARVVMPVAL